MPSLAYTSLLNLTSKYVDSRKAEEVLQRQLKACTLTADNLNNDQIKANSSRFVFALSLYISDNGKRDELSAKIAAL